MSKIITKSVADKVAEWKKYYDAPKTPTFRDGDEEVYAVSNGSDFLMLAQTDMHNAIEYVFKGKGIDVVIEPFEPETYEFYAWIEQNSDHVDADAFHHWVENDEYDDYFFSLYAQWLYHTNEVFKAKGTIVEPDFKEQTLADKLKEEFSHNKLNRGAFLECVEKMFKEETCGKGAFLKMSHSSFYEHGFSWGGIRTINDPITLYVNANCMKEARNILKEEGFTLTNKAGYPDVWQIHLC